MVLSGKILREARADSIQFRLRLRPRHSRLQPAGDLQPMTGAPLCPAAEQRILPERHPHLIDVGEHWKAERRGHDADNGKRAAIEHDRAAGDVRVRVESGLPEMLAQHGGGSGAWRAV